MGQEARCVARIGERRAEVKALLETDELILRASTGCGCRSPAWTVSRPVMGC